LLVPLGVETSFVKLNTVAALFDSLQVLWLYIFIEISVFRTGAFSSWGCFLFCSA